MPDTKDLRGNELSSKKQFLAGILLIVFTLLPIWLILAYWPDQIPVSRDQIKPLYINEIYHIRLAGIKTSDCCADSFLINSASGPLINNQATDSSIIDSADTSSKKAQVSQSPDTVKSQLPRFINQNKLIDLNTIVLILVASGGFLGNMIHIGSSFTNFIGAGQFKRSWLLWYFVKPFTASALAIGLYFVFRGGFLNYSADTASINLYGMLTISILAGLFTDRATLKLSDVFDVVFSLKKDLKSDDNRPNKLEPSKPKIESVKPDILNENIENVLVLTGDHLTTKTLNATINGEPVILSGLTENNVNIKYTIPVSQKAKDDFIIELKDADNNLIFTAPLKRNKSLTTVDTNAQTETPVQPKQHISDEETNDTDDDNHSFVKG